MLKIIFEAQTNRERKKAEDLLLREIKRLRFMPRGCEYFFFEMERHKQSGYQTGNSVCQFQQQGARASSDHIGMNKSSPAAMFMTWIIIKKCFTGGQIETAVIRSAACLNHTHNTHQYHPKLQSWWRFGWRLNCFSSCAWLQFYFCRHHFLPCFTQPSLAASFHESLIVRESPEGRIS